MNFSRLKNIYTLGPSHRSLAASRNHHSHSDIFEKDPFKVQSYNFRYADRPRSSMYSKVLNKKNNNHIHSGYNNNTNNVGSNKNNSNNNGNGNSRYGYDKRFETHFMNRNFSRNHNEDSATNYNKFYENRRRKFVQEHRNPFRTSLANIPHNSNTSYNSNYNTKSLLTPTVSPFLKSVCNRADMRYLQPCNSRSSVCSINSLHNRKSTCGLVPTNKEANSQNSKRIKASKSLKLRDNSVCQININIIRSEDKNSPEGNFKIEIEAEKKNDNVKLNNSMTETTNYNLNLTNKKSFLGVKSTSKISLKDKKLANSKHSLQTIESSVSSIGKSLERITSSKRLPSLVPWKAYDSRDCFEKLEPLDKNDDCPADFSLNLNRNHLQKTNSSLCALRGSVGNLPRRLNSFSTLTNDLNRTRNFLTGGLRCPNINFRSNNFNNNLDLCNTNNLNIVKPFRENSSNSYENTFKTFRL